MSTRPLVLLEFNELSIPLMDEFIACGQLPNFASIRAQSQLFVTDAGEDPPALNPWIQWVTLHSGRSFAEHGVFHLGDAPSSNVPMLWDAVCAAGHSAWLCGSMNISVKPGFKGWILPDPWDAQTKATPAEFDKYMKLVRAYVLEHTSGRRPVTLATAAQFVGFMLGHGLRPSTALRIARHLVDERFNDSSWKRASVLDWLQFDVFRYIWKRDRPTLATLFFNSTAHYQHAFWRNMQPELFTIKPSEREQRSKKNAVLFGYQQMDRIVGDVLKFVTPDTVVAFATALSQQPCLVFEAQGGKTFYKPHDIGRMLRFVGIDPSTCRAEPVMSEQFHLRFTDHATASAAKALLDQTRLEDGTPVFRSRLEGEGVFTGCAIIKSLPADTRLVAPGQTMAFTDVFYQIEALKSGMHHRDGMLWIRDPDRKPQQHAEKIPLTAVAQMLLSRMRLSAQTASDHAAGGRLNTNRLPNAGAPQPM